MPYFLADEKRIARSGFECKETNVGVWELFMDIICL